MIPARLNAILVSLASASGWLRCFFLLGFGAAAAGVCWWLVLQELQQSLPAQSSPDPVAQTRRMERQAAVQKAQSQLALGSLQKEQLATLESALPSGKNAQGAWAAVHQASRRHGLRMEQFKPGPVGSETPYPQQRAAVRLSGSFDALTAFTRTLAEARSPVGLESYVLISQTSAGGDGGGSLILEATLLSLHQPARLAAPALATAFAAGNSATPEGQGQLQLPGLEKTAALARDSDSDSSPLPAVAPFARPPGKPGDPFESQRLSAAPADSGATTALNSLPLSAVRMVGSVRAADQTAALPALTALVLIGGTLHAVRVGDALGNARGRVAEIRVDGLTVREPGSPGTAQASAATTLWIAKD